MKRFLCSIAAILMLFGTAAAYNGNETVYITRTGECYHRERCSYLKSCIETTLEDAVSMGYRACSRCHPPAYDETGKPSASQSLTREGRQYVGRITEERDLALQQKEDAEREAAAVRQELSSFKKNIFFASLIVGFVGIPLYFVWFSAWRKQEIKRITAAVMSSMTPAPQTGCACDPPTRAMPTPKPTPKASPPPIRNAYDLKRENPYLREAYRQRYEGTSISEEAGVPLNCGVWFDAEGFPHRQNRQKTDEFTVYITDKGKSYHTASCPSAKYGRAVNICYAKQRGLGPCGRCSPMAELPHWITEYQRIFRICKAFGIDVKP